MNTLYWLITITDRHSTDAFLALYEEHGITVSLRTVGAGTAVRETLSTLGLEQTEKAVLFAMITAETWPGLQKDLRRKMRIDVPGTGIAFIIPVSSIGGKRALQFLTEHQTFALKEESTLKDTCYELLLVIAIQKVRAVMIADCDSLDRNGSRVLEPVAMITLSGFSSLISSGVTSQFITILTPSFWQRWM